MEIDKQELTEPVVDEWEKVDSIILGYVTGFDEQSRPLVSFVYRGSKHQFAAITTGVTGTAGEGRQVALSFVDGALNQPIILGSVYSPLNDMLESIEVATSEEREPVQAGSSLLEQPVKVDGKNVLIEGAEQVELRCGEASIILTKAGKILIRGKYLLNRASGVNRIVGGSVQVN